MHVLTNLHAQELLFRLLGVFGVVAIIVLLIVLASWLWEQVIEVTYRT